MDDNQDDYKNTVTAGDPKDQSTMKKYPLKPTMWDEVKEGFEPTATRAMLDQVRKRRMAAMGQG